MIHRADIFGWMTKYNTALLVISLLGLALRVYHLGTQNLWTDEAHSAVIAKLTLPQMMATQEVLAYPLHYVILHYWMNLFGTSEFAVRFLSLMFGVLAIPMIYLLGRRLFSEEVGLISAFVLSISQFNIQYSQEARMYSMLFFFALLSMYFFIRFLERGSLAVSVGYVLSTTLLVYTHIFGALVIIAQNIFLAGLLLWSRQPRSRLRQWIPIQAIIIVILAPFIYVLSHTPTLPYDPTLVNSDLMTVVLNLAAGGWGTYDARVALLILFVGLAAFSLFAFRKAAQKTFKSYAWEDRKNLETVCLLVVWLLSIIALPFFVTPPSGRFFVAARYMIAASAPLYLLVAKGIRNINYNYAKVAVIAIIVVLSAANLQTYYSTWRNETVANAVNYVNKHAQQGDLVIEFYGITMMTQYYKLRPDLEVKPFPSAFRYLYTKTVDQNVKDWTTTIEGHRRVWVICSIDTNGTKPLRNAVFGNLERSYDLKMQMIRKDHDPDVRLYVQRA